MNWFLCFVIKLDRVIDIDNITIPWFYGGDYWDCVSYALTKLFYFMKRQTVPVRLEEVYFNAKDILQRSSRPIWKIFKT